MKAWTISLAHGQVMKTTFEPLKRQYRHSPRGKCQQPEEQPQTLISHHSPWGECQYSEHQESLRNCITRPWASDIVKRKLVTKVSKGREVAKGWNNSRPGRELTADVVVDNIGFKLTGPLSRISAWKWISYLAKESNATELSYRKCFTANWDGLKDTRESTKDRKSVV